MRIYTKIYFDNERNNIIKKVTTKKRFGIVVGKEIEETKILNVTGAKSDYRQLALINDYNQEEWDDIFYCSEQELLKNKLYKNEESDSDSVTTQINIESLIKNLEVIDWPIEFIQKIKEEVQESIIQAVRDFGSDLSTNNPTNPE